MRTYIPALQITNCALTTAHLDVRIWILVYTLQSAICEKACRNKVIARYFFHANAFVDHKCLKKQSIAPIGNPESCGGSGGKKTTPAADLVALADSSDAHSHVRARVVVSSAAA